MKTIVLAIAWTAALAIAVSGYRVCSDAANEIGDAP